jgi:multiple sugar transport system permease protein
MLLVIGYPLIFTMYISFTAWDTVAPASKAFTWFSNYIRVFSSPSFGIILKNTFVFVLGTIVLEFLIGLGLALILWDKRFIRKTYILTILLIPVAISPVVTGQLWRYLYEPSNGTINALLRVLGFNNPPLWLASAKLAMPSLILAHVWQWAPLMMLLIFSGLQSIPEEIFEAARIDGASGFKLLFNMTLPLARNPIMIALIFSTIISFKVFDLIFLTTYGGPGEATEVFSISVYKTGLYYFRLNSAAALSQVLFALSLIVITLYTRQMKAER